MGSNAFAAQCSVSPTPQPTYHQGTAQTSASALCKKVVCFEEKDSVPVLWTVFPELAGPGLSSMGVGGEPPVDK
ncbi:hypothetical protein P691DRAFT_765491 [Macrolepiota fuliginosa MF-IS2]|uniref:Uncharacterized protein n=1 Tax=Macrolepiota fuliginosa MF-IS2 TaxID=1400762 RepID=A0A9P5WZU3_9AGAR|nr:hypothetical protein P691DRAFT_765491 [Macrolepiota fuliginosa MF-IS2]